MSKRKPSVYRWGLEAYGLQSHPIGCSLKKHQWSPSVELISRVDAASIREETEPAQLAIECNQQLKSGSQWAAWIAGVSLIVATVGAPMAESLMHKPTGIGCSKERSDAYDLWTKTSVWTPMPIEADTCGVNGYMEEVTVSISGDE